MYYSLSRVSLLFFSCLANFAYALIDASLSPVEQRAKFGGYQTREREHHGSRESSTSQRCLWTRTGMQKRARGTARSLKVASVLTSRANVRRCFRLF